MLLETALLPKVTAADAESLTGVTGRARRCTRSPGAATSRRAAAARNPRTNITRIFRAFLLARAEKELPPERLRTLRIAAAARLRERGQVDDALELLAAARAWDELAALLLDEAPVLCRERRIATLLRWIAALPPHVAETWPWLAYWSGACTALEAPRDGRAILERAFERFRQDRDAAGVYKTWSAIVESYMWEWSEFAPLDRSIEVLEDLRREFPFPDAALEARVAASEFNALLWRQPAHPSLPRSEERLRGMALASNGHAGQLELAAHIVVYHAWCGDHAGLGVLIHEFRRAANSRAIRSARRSGTTRRRPSTASRGTGSAPPRRSTLRSRPPAPAASTSGT